MPQAARLGDVCTGHGCWPTRPNAEGSPNVFVNGRALHCVGHAWQAHTCPDIPETHASVLGGGSSTVIVNGREAGRIGDPVACGSSVATGSPNVIIGG